MNQKIKTKKVKDSEMIELHGTVLTKAAKELVDVARRYNLPTGEQDKRPVINLPAGTSLVIDGVWEGGYLSAIYREHSFPVSYDEVEEGLYRRLILKFGDGSVRCPNCEGGWRHDYEEGHPTTDACYTCGNTGRLTAEQYKGFRLRVLCDMLGADVTQRMKQGRDSNPDGEGWAFCAAENGMREYDYTQAYQMQESDRANRALTKLCDEGHSMLVEVLVERLVPVDESLLVPEGQPRRPLWVYDQPKGTLPLAKSHDAMTPAEEPKKEESPKYTDDDIPF